MRIIYLQYTFDVCALMPAYLRRLRKLGEMLQQVLRPYLNNSNSTPIIIYSRKTWVVFKYNCKYNYLFINVFINILYTLLKYFLVYVNRMYLETLNGEK